MDDVNLMSRLSGNCECFKSLFDDLNRTDVFAENIVYETLQADAERPQAVRERDGVLAEA